MTRLLVKGLLSILLLGGMISIWGDRVDELTYFFSSRELLSLGNPESLDLREVGDDVFVRLSGKVGTHFARLSGMRPGSFRFGPIQVRKLENIPLFVEYDETKYGDSFLPSTLVEVTGRLQSFNDRSELKKIKAYFEKELGILVPENARIIIVDEIPGNDYRYPVLFVFSLFAFLGSLYSIFFASSRNIL